MRYFDLEVEFFNHRKSLFCCRTRNLYFWVWKKIYFRSNYDFCLLQAKAKAYEWWTNQFHSLHWENCDLHNFESNTVFIWEILKSILTIKNLEFFVQFIRQKCCKSNWFELPLVKKIVFQNYAYCRSGLPHHNFNNRSALEIARLLMIGWKKNTFKKLAETETYRSPNSSFLREWLQRRILKFLLVNFFIVDAVNELVYCKSTKNLANLEGRKQFLNLFYFTASFLFRILF